MDVLMDYLQDLNWIAVLVAAVAAFATGAVWYSQALFGKRWMKLAGLTDKDAKNANMLVVMGISFVTVVVTAAALAVLFDVLALEGVVNGAVLGVLASVGFIVTNKKMHCLFEQKPYEYFVITALGDVVSLAVMGGVLGLFS